MNALLLRFALFLSTSTALGLLALAGPAADAGPAPAIQADATCALDALVVAAGDAIEAREHRVGTRQRPARWQNLLPGAFL